MSRKIYLASSWRNLHQESILAALREAGPAPVKGPALVGTERRGEEGGGDGK